jgi:hypothetical protein
MQEIRDKTSVGPCLDLPNRLMRPYLVVPTYLKELWCNISPCLGRLKDGTFRLSLSYLATSLTSIEENMILRYLNISHSGTLFGMWFLTLAQQLFLLILPSIGMWSSWVRRMGTTQVMYIAKLKDGPKRVTKTFSMIWKTFLKWYDGGGQNGII